MTLRLRNYSDPLWMGLGTPYVGVPSTECTGLLQAYRNIAGDSLYRALVTSPTSGILVLDSGEVVFTSTSTVTYDIYIDGGLVLSDVVWTSGWAIGGEPQLIAVTPTEYVIQGQASVLGNVYGILQQRGRPSPTYDQIVAGTDYNDDPARGFSSALGDISVPVTLTVERTVGIAPIHDVFVVVEGFSSVWSFPDALLQPPAGKGFVVVGNLPAQGGSMLTELQISAAEGDVIEYDLLSRPSSLTVTITPDGLRSAA